MEQSKCASKLIHVHCILHVHIALLHIPNKRNKKRPSTTEDLERPSKQQKVINMCKYIYSFYTGTVYLIILSA